MARPVLPQRHTACAAPVALVAVLAACTFASVALGGPAPAPAGAADTLAAAALTGRVADVAAALAAGAPINSRNRLGRTALAAAAAAAAPDGVAALLAAGAAVNAADNAGRTPLHAAVTGVDGGVGGTCRLAAPAYAPSAASEAAADGVFTPPRITRPLPMSAATVVRALLAAGAAADATDDGGVTPLHLAAAGRCGECVRALLAAGADAALADEAGGTALHAATCAVRWSRRRSMMSDGDQAAAAAAVAVEAAAAAAAPDVVRQLLVAGAPVDAAMKVTAVTPLLHAAEAGNAPVVYALLAAGADATVETAQGSTAITRLLQGGADEATGAELVAALAARGARVGGRSDRWRSPLGTAALLMNLPVVNALIAAGARANDVGDSPEKPLFTWLVLSTVTINGPMKNPALAPVLAALIGAGWNVSSTLVGTMPPLDVAIRYGAVDVAGVLLDAGLPLTGRGSWNGCGRPPLAAAAEWAPDDAAAVALVTALLRRGAPINEQSARGWSALHIAAARGQPATLRLLLQRGAATPGGLADATGRTALHVAAAAGQAAAVGVLVEAGGGGAINGTTPEGESALHLAAAAGAADAVRALVAAGACVRCSSGEGVTPAAAAAAAGKTSLAAWLDSYGRDGRPAVADIVGSGAATLGGG